LHGYAAHETCGAISKAVSEEKLDWAMLHMTLYTHGLGIREQSGGLVVFDLFHPDSVSVKASDIHPEIRLPKMKRRSVL